MISQILSLLITQETIYTSLIVITLRSQTGKFVAVMVRKDLYLPLVLEATRLILDL